MKRAELSPSDTFEVYDIAELIGRVALSDKAAFDALYSQTSSKLFGVLLRLLGNRADAEDALQDVYVKIWHKADRFATQRSSAGGKPNVSPMAWLVAIARNHAIDKLRARKAPSVQIDEVVEIVADGDKNPEQHALASSDARGINHCMERLDADKAEAVRAAYMEGYSYQELADKYKTPLNTMRTWLRRSLQSLRQCLEETQ